MASYITRKGASTDAPDLATPRVEPSFETPHASAASFTSSTEQPLETRHEWWRPSRGAGTHGGEANSSLGGARRLLRHGRDDHPGAVRDCLVSNPSAGSG